MFLTLSLIFSASVLGQKVRMNPATGMFLDPFNRSTIFHGVNVVYKTPPYIPITSSFDPQLSLNNADIANLVSWGFNFVRLGVMWEAVETSMGVYNQTYLNLIVNLINNLGKNGIYTLVDMHQDVFARKICGEGVPDFYAQNLSDKCDGPFGAIIEKLGGCTPFSSYNYTYVNGNPIISDCLTHFFADYYATPEAADAFYRLYKNEKGLQDQYFAFWNFTSFVLSGNQYVVGYDLINEPLAANMVKQPWTAIPGVNDFIHLQPMYESLHSIIRANDNDTILFFEPIQGDVLPALGGMVLPMGFNSTPGGTDYNDRQLLNDHAYCCQSSASICAAGEPPLDKAKQCAEFNFARVTSRKLDADGLGVGLIISEFGACLDSVSCVYEITGVTNACDYNMVGWAYWEFKGYNDFTTSANLQEGFYNNQTLQVGKVKALARTYVQYYQGTPSKMYFDPSTGFYTTTFELDPSVTKPTVLFYSTEFYYPQGANLVVTNAQGLTPTITKLANYYEIMFTSAVASSTTIVLTPV
jgi:endoglycosylceramidase